MCLPPEAEGTAGASPRPTLRVCVDVCLFHILLGAVVEHPEAHLPLVGGGEELDAGAVEGGTEPRFRVEPQIHAQPLLVAFVVHMLHLTQRMPKNGGKQPGNAPSFGKMSQRSRGNRGNLWLFPADLHQSIDFLVKRIYTKKIQHTHFTEELRTMLKKWDVTIPALTGDVPRKAYIYLPEYYDDDPNRPCR